MKKTNNIRTVSQTDIFISQGIFFAMVFLFFCFVGNYIIYFQETQFLFVFSGDYLHEHLLKPGALLEYTARFLSQFYHSRLSGSLIVSVILSLPLIITYLINKRLINGISFSLVLLLLPSCLLLLMQANYYHLMEYNLGFLLVLSYYLFSISSGKKLRQVFVIILFPLFYYLAGAYAMIFAVMYIVHNLFPEKDKQKYIHSLLLLLIAAVTFLLSWKILFLQPIEQFILFPLPLLKDPAYKAVFIILTSYIVLYPLLCRIAGKFKESKLNSRIYSLISAILVFGIIIFLVVKTFKPQTARVVKLERLIFEEKWQEAIRLQEKKPARNLIGEYFYNIALSETGLLCDRLFYGPQDFLAGSLVLPWGDVHLDRGAYFYYTIGLMNEAHRWAYKEMVVFGYRPQNIRMLAKTSLINGDYAMARKYLDILKKTIYYRKWAMGFEKLADNPAPYKISSGTGTKIEDPYKKQLFHSIQ